MGEKKGALNVEQSRNVRNGSGATGRHISTDAAINQKKRRRRNLPLPNAVETKPSAV